MQYAKKVFLLKPAQPEGRLAILTIETRDTRVSYHLSERMREVVGSGLYVFYDERISFCLGNIETDEVNLRLNLEEIQAAAIIQTGESCDFLLTGENTSRFNWQLAKSEFKIKYQQNRERAAAEEKSLQALDRKEENGTVSPFLETNAATEAKSEDVEKYYAAVRTLLENPVQQAETETPVQPVKNQIPAPYLPNIPRMVNEPVIECPVERKTVQFNPFPGLFTESLWYKIDFPFLHGEWHYIAGEIYLNGVLAARATGVPGEYSLAPPRWLDGFGTYLNADAGAKGYWLMFEDDEGNRMSVEQLRAK